MSLGNQLAPVLPFTRRFGLALLGSQELADQFVRQTLERIILQPDLFPRELGAVLGITKLFLEAVNNTPNREIFRIESERPRPGQTQIERAAAMPFRERTAFLLSALEGFDANTIAYLTNSTEKMVGSQLLAAAQWMAQDDASLILIAEPEPIISGMLEQVLVQMGHRVVKADPSRDALVSAAFENRPALVITEAILADFHGDGLRALEDIRAVFEVPAIISTASPEIVARRLRSDPFTYLLPKPWEVPALREYVLRALYFSTTDRLALPELDMALPEGFSGAADTDAVEEEGSPTARFVYQDRDGLTQQSIAPLAEQIASLPEDDVAQLPAAVSAHVVGGQLRRERRGKVRGKAGPAGTDALRRLHHDTAVALCEELLRTNLGGAILIRMERIRDTLAQPFDETSGLSLGVQAEGLTDLRPIVQERLTEEPATHMVRFMKDLAALAWSFPEYQAFAEHARTAEPVDDAEMATLVAVAKQIESQPDDQVAPDLKEEIGSERVNAQHSDDPVARLSFKRAVENGVRAWMEFLRERMKNVNENTWKTFDKATGGAIGSVISVMVVVLPTYAIMSYFFPGYGATWAAIIGLAKMLKLMTP